jgi:hypothetical protein
MAVYYVRTDGSNANSGTSDNSGGAWLTIAYAESQVAAGDSVYIRSGTYDDQASVSTTGTAGNYINFVGHGDTKPITRGFIINSVSYRRFINLEITHVDLTYNHGFRLSNVGTGSHIEFHDNYIHEIQGQGIRSAGSGTENWDDILIRGNTFYYMGYVPGLSETAGAAVANGGTGVSDRWLIEYNDMQRCGDFVNNQGKYGTLRNNSMGDFANSYWSGVGDSLHCDIVQDGPNSGWRTFEANWIFDNAEANSHIWQHRDLGGNDDGYMVYRGNVGFNIGSGNQYGGMNHGKWYHDTYYDLQNVALAGIFMNFSTEAGESSNDNLVTSVIFHTISGSASELFPVGAGGDVTASNNIGYLTVSDASLVSTADPSLVDVASDDFRLSASSTAALGAGTAITTITSATGSGTSFTVADPYVFRDGGSSWHPFVEGDTITTEVGDTVQITAINYGTSTVTVDASVSWTLGDDIFWGSDNTPDIGALPYDSGNSYSLTAELTRGSPNVVSVNDTSICRMVVFYEDGIPQDPAYTAPYQYTDSGGTVTAKVYARFATQTPVVEAVESTSNNLPKTSGRNAALAFLF